MMHECRQLAVHDRCTKRVAPYTVEEPCSRSGSRLWARLVRGRGGATPAQFVRGEENLNEGALMATRIFVNRLSASAAATTLREADGRSWHVDAPHRANTGVTEK